MDDESENLNLTAVLYYSAVLGRESEAVYCISVSSGREQHRLFTLFSVVLMWHFKSSIAVDNVFYEQKTIIFPVP